MNPNPNPNCSLIEEESAIGMVHNHSPSERIITRRHDAIEGDAENGMVVLILQRLYPKLNVICSRDKMHMYVLPDNALTVIPCAVNGKGG